MFWGTARGPIFLISISNDEFGTYKKQNTPANMVYLIVEQLSFLQRTRHVIRYYKTRKMHANIDIHIAIGFAVSTLQNLGRNISRLYRANRMKNTMFRKYQNH